jgi:hypothetical protein
MAFKTIKFGLEILSKQRQFKAREHYRVLSELKTNLRRVALPALCRSEKLCLTMSGLRHR